MRREKRKKCRAINLVEPGILNFVNFDILYKLC